MYMYQFKSKLSAYIESVLKNISTQEIIHATNSASFIIINKVYLFIHYCIYIRYLTYQIAPDLHIEMNYF